LKTSLNSDCMFFLRKVYLMARNVLPYERSEKVCASIDSFLKQGQAEDEFFESRDTDPITSSTALQFTSWDMERTSLCESKFACPEGVEQLRWYELKKACISDILHNAGYTFKNASGVVMSKYTTDTTLEWKDHQFLSEDQVALKHLAALMCLNIQKTCILQNGVIVFVSPAGSKDVPEILKQIEEQGTNRIGLGTMLVSTHLKDLVWAVLNPRYCTNKGILAPYPPKNAVFPKKKDGTTTILPAAPGGEFHEQGLESSQKAQFRDPDSHSAPTPRVHLDVYSHTDSLETRRTRTTGDLPNQTSSNRPNVCDRPHRQILKGTLHGDRFARHRKDMM